MPLKGLNSMYRINSSHEKKIKKRTAILLFFLSLWLGAIIFRLIQLQVIAHPQLKASALKQTENITPIFPKRGSIYDRSGNILARSLPSYSVFYSPFKEEPLEIHLKKIEELRKTLHLTEREVREITSRIKDKKTFIWIKRKISPELSEKVKELHLSGVYLKEESKRFYPYGKLAAHVIGRVNIDDVGASGIEYKYNSILEGKKGKCLILKDAKRREYRVEVLKESIPGFDITLTLDETIQYIAEKELEKTIRKTQAKWGSIIVSRPSIGEIMAMANFPTFDLNSKSQALFQVDRNKAIHHIFDPGSTFKIVTASAAIEFHKVRFNDTFDCSEGAFTIPGTYKKIRDYRRFGILTFPEVIIHSSNVGTIQIGQQVGEDTLFHAIKAFGFGQETGIDLPAEERGIFNPPNTWSKFSLASLSIGYEISVTAIQLLQAINIIANEGMLIPPKVVLSTSLTGEKDTSDFPEAHQVVSPETAKIVSYLLQKVVQEGTGTSAQIDEYTVAGKTGTAQKFDLDLKQYSSESHISSFVGFVPAENPAISIVVVIDDPKGPYYGGQVAAPLFRDIAQQVLRYLKVPSQEQRESPLITAKSWRTNTQ